MALSSSGSVASRSSNSSVAGLAEVGVAVQRHLAVQRQDLIVGGAHQRVDLDQGGVLGDEDLPQLGDGHGGGVEHLGRQVALLGDRAGERLVDTLDRVHRDLGQPLGLGGRDLFDLHAALHRAHGQVGAVGAVQQEGDVVLLGDVAGLGDQQLLHDVALDVETEDVLRVVVGVLGGRGVLHAAGLASSTDLDLRLDHHRVDRSLRRWLWPHRRCLSPGRVWLGRCAWRTALSPDTRKDPWAHFCVSACLQAGRGFPLPACGNCIETARRFHRRHRLMWQISPRPAEVIQITIPVGFLAKLAMPRARRLTSQGPDNVMVTARRTSHVDPANPGTGSCARRPFGVARAQVNHSPQRSHRHHSVQRIRQTRPTRTSAKTPLSPKKRRSFAPPNSTTSTTPTTSPSSTSPAPAHPSVASSPLERGTNRARNDAESLAGRGQHRKQLTGPTRGRVLIGSMAAGAAAAAAHSATEAPEHSKAQTVLAAQSAADRADQHLRQRHADGHRATGRQCRRAQRRVGPWRRVRSGARRSARPDCSSRCS